MSFDKIKISGNEYEFQDSVARNILKIWEPGETYNSTQFVTHEGVMYKVLHDNVLAQSENPPSSNSTDYQQVAYPPEELVSRIDDIEIGINIGDEFTPSQIFKIVDNKDYTCAFTDGNGMFIGGIKSDGVWHFPNGIESERQLFIKDLEKSNFKFIITDSNESSPNILAGVFEDGEWFFAKGMPEDTKTALEAVYRTINDKYEELDNSIKANKSSVDEKLDALDTYIHTADVDGTLFSVTDSNNNQFLGVDKDGALVVDRIKGVFNADVVENDNYVLTVLDNKNNLLFGVRRDGALYAHSADITGMPEITDSEEFLYVITDNSKKILFGITTTGHVYYEKGMSMEVHDKLKSINTDIDEFHKAIANFHGGTGDWSESDHLEIPIPRCALINITASHLPTAKSGMGTAGDTCDIPSYMEFWDMAGNYFKKPILFSGQGNSSMAFVKKNFAFDIFLTEDDRANDGDTFKIKFGDWVPQDSFHIKAYYTDTFRGRGTCSYMLYEQMVKTRSIFEDRPYKTAFIDESFNQDSNFGYDCLTELEQNFETGAKCFPMGFPVIMYFNGEFYGVYAWQLKKHRDNFMMDKKTAEHVHLDGKIDANTLFGGYIDWTQFEVRNPKNLYMQTYQTIRKESVIKYNGDYPREIMGKDSEYYDKSDKNKKRCATVKEYIERFSNYVPELYIIETGLNTHKPAIINDITTNHTHTSSTSLNTIGTCVFIGDDEWLVYLSEDDTDTFDTQVISWYQSQYDKIKPTFDAARQSLSEITKHTIRVFDNNTINQSVCNSLLNESGLSGYSISFDSNTPSGNIQISNNTIKLPIPTANKPYLKILNVHNFLNDVRNLREMQWHINERFIPSFIVDYILETNLMQDTDGYAKNWQWTTYDGVRWVCNPYDHDGVFGAYHIGNYINSAYTTLLGTMYTVPSGWFIKYFKEDWVVNGEIKCIGLKNRWKELRDKKIFDTRNIVNILRDWCDRIGSDNFKKEYKKWNESPCNRPSYIDTENWSKYNSYVNSYSTSRTYAINDVCSSEGNTFKSKTSKNTIRPTLSTTYWKSVPVSLFDIKNVYNAGDCVLFNDNLYVSNTSNNDQNLDNNNNWVLLDYTEFDPNVTYNKDAYVMCLGVLYKSISNNNIGHPNTNPENYWTNVTWSPVKTYNVGDVVYYSSYNTESDSKSDFDKTSSYVCYGFKSLKTNNNKQPITKFYNSYPRELGCYDNIYRVSRWLDNRIKNIDNILNYTQI